MKHFNIGNLHFQASTLIVIVALLAIIVTAILCVMAVRRSARPKRTGALEALRFFCVLLAAAMLLGPEWRTVESSDLQPEIAIVWDDSLSMTTEDARLPKVLSSDEKIVARQDLVSQIRETEFWKPFELDDKNRVTFSSFGAPPVDGDPALAAMSGSDLNQALKEVLESGRNLRAVIMMSDGTFNIGKSPVDSAQQMRLRGIPLYAMGTGAAQRLPDLDLESVNAPTYGIVGENVQIPFSIESSLPRDVRTIVRLRSETGKERTKDIVIPANSSFDDSLLWRIEKEGATKLTLSIPYANDELVESNNSREFMIAGKPESIKVLVIETLPRWEYRFIRNALSRDPGVKVDCLLLHPQLGKGDGPDYIAEFPEKLEDLQKYDVVFVGDVGIGEGGLTVEQADLIKGLVESQASGVVFIPGPQGNQFDLAKSELGDLIPVDLDETKKEGFSDSTASPMRLTSEGEKSLLTMLGDDERQNESIWQSLPGFYWQAPVIKAKAGTQVLAVNDNRRNSSGRVPILVTSRAGSGKVLYLAIDSAWRWRRGVEDLYHYRFWGQVARWMSYQRNMAAGERVRLFFSPERPKPGESVFLSANAFSAEGAPLTEGSLQVQITAPDGSVSIRELVSEDSSWGAFSGKFSITQPGTWTLRASVGGDDSAAVVTKIISQTDPIEKAGLPARFDVLEEMAKVSNGRLVTPSQLDALVNEIKALPEPQPLVNSVKLWAHWFAPTLLVILLALFWIGRKLNGTF
ncbi:hypothetical protein N9B40_01970 [Akkermansiaceae bacterium]|nr:hypothetical protein [Akkermansiaceae bacterium]